MYYSQLNLSLTLPLSNFLFLFDSYSRSQVNTLFLLPFFSSCWASIALISPIYLFNSAFLSFSAEVYSYRAFFSLVKTSSACFYRVFCLAISPSLSIIVLSSSCALAFTESIWMLKSSLCLLSNCIYCFNYSMLLSSLSF